MLRDAALKLAAKGMRVFPCIERGKEPALHDNLKRATTDENHIKGWWNSRQFNIGIATGQASGVWVLDIDGEDGEATLRHLEAEYGRLPPTVEVITGKGRHIYFRWPPDGPEIRNSQMRAGLPGIDVRGNGGYVLAPPSVHPNGRTYEWSVDGENEFADAPDWLITLVTARVYPAGATFGSANSPEYWRSFVNEPVEGSHRHQAIARLYGLLIRRWIDPYVALDLARLFNSARCHPPLDDRELVRTCGEIAAREANRRENTQ
jgi:hypothetical protein